MKKVANFLVKYRNWIMGFMLLLATASGYMLTKVNINYDLAEYLGDNSRMKIGLDIMENEFDDGETSTIKVMIEGLDNSGKVHIYDLLSTIDDVTIAYDIASENYNIDDYTLYLISIPYDAYSARAREIFQEVEKILISYQAYYAGDAVDAQNNYLTIVIVIGVIMLLIVLILMSHSWIEPFIIMIAIGIAVLINMGTNIIFPSVSYITFSIAAVLQLVLSLDYSIMLMERYRQEKNGRNSVEAMKNALSKGAQSILSSSITTMVSLLCLVFMSFTFGLDIGLVLAKGILFSLITSFTVLPALILLMEKLIDKTKKKTLEIKMDKVANIGYKLRYAVLSLFIVLLAGSTYLSFHTNYSYFLPPTAKDYQLIEEKFPGNSQIIIVYKNDDESKIYSFAQEVLQKEHTLSVDSYSTTIGALMDAPTLANTISIDEMIVKGLLYDYFEGDITDLTLNELSSFIVDDLVVNPTFNSYFTEDIIIQMTNVKTFTNPEIINGFYNSMQLSFMIGIDESQVEDIIELYYIEQSQPHQDTISLFNFIGYLLQLSQDPMYEGMFDPATISQMSVLFIMMNSALEETKYSSEQMELFVSSMFPDFNQNMIDIIYLLYFGNHNYEQTSQISIYDFVDYLVNDVVDIPEIAFLFDQSYIVEMQESFILIQEAKTSLIGTTHSRLIITTSFAVADESSIVYLEEVKQLLDDDDVDYYMVGTIPMSHEMNQSFKGDLYLITAITAIAIYIVVAFAFKSFFVPIILQLFIQTSIYLTMALTMITGNTLYFLAIIIVQAILMGAAIDYAILFTSYYRNQREKYDIKQSLKNAYRGSIPTIITSSIVLIAVTTTIGLISVDAVIASVVLTLAKGMAISVILTLFLLPPIIAVFDKAVCHKNKKNKHLKTPSYNINKSSK